MALGEVAERVGKSKPTVSNRVRLLELPDDVLAMVERRELSEGHARAVLAVPDHDGRRRLARRIVAEGLSVRAAERAARWAGARTKERQKSNVDPEVAGRIKDAFRLLTGLRGEGRSRGRAPADRRRRAARRARRSARASRRLKIARPAATASRRGEDGRSWIRTRDLRLIRAAL